MGFKFHECHIIMNIFTNFENKYNTHVITYVNILTVLMIIFYIYLLLRFNNYKLYFIVITSTMTNYS